MANEIWLFRHGETEWSKSGAHTSRTDLSLTPDGRGHAKQLGRWLAGREFSAVFTSPLKRARETCELAGYGDVAQIDPNLHEWDYGDYEGLSTPDIRKKRPDWNLWRDGVPNGEAIGQVAARSRTVIDGALKVEGDVALFAHGHVLRILTACWLDQTPDAARLYALSTASVSSLGFERDTRVITTWNISVGKLKCDGQT